MPISIYNFVFLSVWMFPENQHFLQPHILKVNIQDVSGAFKLYIKKINLLFISQLIMTGNKGLTHVNTLLAASENVNNSNS